MPSRTAGLLAALVLLIVYIFLWRPARAWLTQHAAYPALAAVETQRAARFAVAPGANPRVVEVRATEGGKSFSFGAPGGIRFLLPGLLLVGLYPRQPYWLYYFWLYHLGLGVLLLALLAIGIGWSDAGFTLHTFLSRYIIDATSLAVALLAVVAHRQPISSEAEPKAPVG